MTLTENIIMNERDNAIQFGQHIPANKIAIQAMVHQDPFSSQSQEGLSSPQSDHRVTIHNHLPYLKPLTGTSCLQYPQPSSENRQMAEIAGLALNIDNSVPSQLPTYSIFYSEDTILLARLSALLQQELSKTCTIITSDMKEDFKNIGERLDNMDGTVKRVNQNSKMILSLQDQLDQANPKIEDLENRSRRYNFHVSGLPETVINLEESIRTLMTHLIPEIPPPTI